MRYVAAYALAVLGGNSSPAAEDIDRILSSVGVEKNQEKIDLIIKLFANRKVEDLIREGGVKLASVPFGGSGGAAVAASSTVQASDAKPAAEQKKEEKVEKEDSESDDDMGFGLFD